MNNQISDVHRVLFLDIGRCGSFFIHSLLIQHPEVCSPPVVITAAELCEYLEANQTLLPSAICKDFFEERNILNLDNGEESKRYLIFDHSECSCSRRAGVELYHLHLALEREPQIVNLIRNLTKEGNVSVIFGFRDWHESISSQVNATSSTVDFRPRFFQLAYVSNNLRRAWINSKELGKICNCLTISLRELYREPERVWNDAISFLGLPAMDLPKVILINGSDFNGNFKGISNALDPDQLWDTSRDFKLSRVRLSKIEKFISYRFMPPRMLRLNSFILFLTRVSLSQLLLMWLTWKKVKSISCIWRLDEDIECECLSIPSKFLIFKRGKSNSRILAARHFYYEFRKVANQNRYRDLW